MHKTTTKNIKYSADRQPGNTSPQLCTVYGSKRLRFAAQNLF